jgi:hypothetical protein
MYDEQEGVTITTTRGVKAVKSFDDMGLRWVACGGRRGPAPAASAGAAAPRRGKPAGALFISYASAAGSSPTASPPRADRAPRR